MWILCFGGGRLAHCPLRFQEVNHNFLPYFKVSQIPKNVCHVGLPPAESKKRVSFLTGRSQVCETKLESGMNEDVIKET